MERFSAAHIRQQPEFQFLMYREKSQVIQTCVEDGEIKFRLNKQPAAAAAKPSNGKTRPTSAHTSTKSGTSSTASNTAVHRPGLTRAHSSAAADRPSAENFQARQRKVGVIHENLYHPPFEDRDFHDFRPSSAAAAATNRHDEIRGQKENEYIYADSKDDNYAYTEARVSNHEQNRSGCEMKGNAKVSKNAQNEVTNSFKRSRETAERSVKTNSKETDSHHGKTGQPCEEDIISIRGSDCSTKQTTEWSALIVGQKSVNENRKDCDSGSNLTPEDNSTAVPCTNKRTVMKPGGFTKLSADTDSTLITEQRDYKHSTDPAIQTTRNDSTQRKVGGNSEEGRQLPPPHPAQEDKSKPTKTSADHCKHNQRILHVGGQVGGVQQTEEHSSSGQDTDADTAEKKMSGPVECSSMIVKDDLASSMDEINEVSAANTPPLGYKHSDKVTHRVDKVVKKDTVRSKTPNTNRIENTKCTKVKDPRASLPDAKHQTSKENGAAHRTTTQNKTQKAINKTETKPSSRKKSSQVTKPEQRKERYSVTRSLRATNLQSKASTRHLDSDTSAAPRNLSNHISTENYQEHVECVSHDKAERTRSPNSGELPYTSHKENRSPVTGSQELVAPSFETPVTDSKVSANDRPTNRASRQINTTDSAANNHVSLDRKQGPQIDHSEGGDQYPMAAEACACGVREEMESEHLTAYPRPVTRVDVSETPRSKDNTTSKTSSGMRHGPAQSHQVHTMESSRSEDAVASSTRNSHTKTMTGVTTAQHGSHSFRTKETGMDDGPSHEIRLATYEEQDEEEDVVPPGSMIPCIIVDNASTIGDASSYSDDMDAVLIDAEEYLAFTQDGHSENKDESSAQPCKQKSQFLKRLANYHKNADLTLNVSQNPELPGEKTPSISSPTPSHHIHKPGMENAHRHFDSSAALELSGLRTTLTPSPYNVEFDPNRGPSSPHAHAVPQPGSKPGTARASPRPSRHSPRPSTSDGTFTRRTSSSASKTSPPKPAGTFLFPQSQEGGGKPGAPKSAMSSRRNSVNSVGTVHWDQAVTDSPALTRQISWEGCSADPPTTRPLPKRRHSSALGTRHEKLLDPAERMIVAQLSSASEPLMGKGSAQGTFQDLRRHSVSLAAYDDLAAAERRLSTASALSTGQRSSLGNQEELDRVELDRQASQYDPRVEKSERYNHQRENAFNQACQWLSPVRRGLKTLQMQYSRTNTTHNDGLIFAHLLRAAHVKNAAVEDAVYSTERRLYTRRHTDVYHATTFFDTPGEDRPATPGGRDHKDTGSRRSSSAASTKPKGYRTVAKRKKERRERIKKKNDELELGYTPRAQTLKQLGPKDIDAILVQCRHLRVSPHLQRHLYSTDISLQDEHVASTPAPLM